LSSSASRRWHCRDAGVDLFVLETFSTSPRSSRAFSPSATSAPPIIAQMTIGNRRPHDLRRTSRAPSPAPRPGWRRRHRLIAAVGPTVLLDAVEEMNTPRPRRSPASRTQDFRARERAQMYMGLADDVGASPVEALGDGARSSP